MCPTADIRVDNYTSNAEIIDPMNTSHVVLVNYRWLHMDIKGQFGPFVIFGSKSGPTTSRRRITIIQIDRAADESTDDQHNDVATRV